MLTERLLLIAALFTGMAVSPWGCQQHDRPADQPASFTIADQLTDVRSPNELLRLAVYKEPREPNIITICDESVVVAAYGGRLSRILFTGKELWSVQEEWSKHEDATLTPSVLGVSADHLLVASCFQEIGGGVTVRAALDGTMVVRSSLNGSNVIALAFDPSNSDILWLVSSEGALERWKIRDGSMERIGKNGSINPRYGAALFALPTTREIMAVELGRAQIWDSESGVLKREFKHDWIYPQTQLAFDGRRAVSLNPASSRGWVNVAIAARMTVWNVADGTREVIVDGWRNTKDNAASIRGAALVADDYLVAWDVVGLLRVIDLTDGAVVGEVETNNRARVVAIPQAGSFVVTTRPKPGDELELVILHVSAP